MNERKTAWRGLRPKIIALAAQGMKNKQIAIECACSEANVSATLARANKPASLLIQVSRPYYEWLLLESRKKSTRPEALVRDLVVETIKQKEPERWLR